MRIDKIEICNLASLEGEQVIDFIQEPLKSAGLFAITGKTGAGKTGLLTGSHAYDLTALGIAHGIGLGVLQGDQGHLHVKLGFRRNGLCRGFHIGKG